MGVKKVIYENDPRFAITCAQQVVFNAKLEEIVVIENPEGKYIDPVMYLSDPAFKEKITNANAEKYVPFLEVIILFNPDGRFSYLSWFHSFESIDKSRWRQIGERINQALVDFARKAGPKFMGKLFFSEDEEKKYIAVRAKTLKEYKDNVQKLQAFFKKAQSEIRKMKKSGKSAADIAIKFKLDKKEVERLLNVIDKSHKAKPAEVAVLATAKYAQELGLDATMSNKETIANNSLHRKGGLLPNVVKSIKPFVYKT